MHRNQRSANRIDAACESDEWQQSWAQHSGWLRTVIAARIEAVWVDEVLQDVAIQAWNHRTQLENSAKLGPWLYRIALQQISLFFRKRNRTEIASTEAIDNSPIGRQSVDPLALLTRDEVHQQIRESMKKLPAEAREILELKHSHEWTYQQIAEHLGLTVDQVIYRTGRAKERLRHFLAGLDFTDNE